MIVWNLSIVNVFTNKDKFSYWQPYNFSRIHEYLWTSPGSGPPPPGGHIGEVKQKHTHKGPSDKSLFLLWNL